MGKIIKEIDLSPYYYLYHRSMLKNLFLLIIISLVVIGVREVFFK